MKQFTKKPSSSKRRISASEEPMSRQKKQTLETLQKVIDVYSEGELLTGGFYEDFINLINEQIDEIERTMK